MKKLTICFLIIALLITGWLFTRAAKTDSTSKATPGFNASQYSLDEPSSIWVVVNKKRPLTPATYAPTDLVIPNLQLRSNITAEEKQLRKPAAEKLEAMVAAAKQDSVTFTLESGYRSYAFQERLYNLYVKQQGKAVADTQSARPGYSEHQTGLALDLGGTSDPKCNVETCYANTVEGKWLAANALNYGFLIRYTDEKETVTGYIGEPWHLRYIGTQLAAEMQKQNIITLEEFFKTGPAPSY